MTRHGPYSTGAYSGYVATQVPDMHMWVPVFADGRIIGFACGHIHNTDMGGAVPPSLSRALTEVHQEGIRCPPMKLVRRGVMNEELRRIMMLNVRKPDQNAGDLRAFIGALNTGERKLLEMAGKFAAMPVHWRFFVKSKLFEFLPRASSLTDAMAALRHAYPEVPAR